MSYAEWLIENLTGDGITVIPAGQRGDIRDPSSYAYRIDWSGEEWYYEVPPHFARKAEAAFKHHQSQAKWASAIKKYAHISYKVKQNKPKPEQLSFNFDRKKNEIRYR